MGFMKQLLMLVVTAMITFAFIGMMVVAREFEQITRAPERAAAVVAAVT